MSEPTIEILEYLTTDGRNPFRDWVEALKDREARARIRVRINRVRLEAHALAIGGQRLHLVQQHDRRTESGEFRDGLLEEFGDFLLAFA